MRLHKEEEKRVEIRGCRKGRGRDGKAQETYEKYGAKVWPVKVEGIRRDGKRSLSGQKKIPLPAFWAVFAFFWAFFSLFLLPFFALAASFTALCLFSRKIYGGSPVLPREVVR